MSDLPAESVFDVIALLAAAAGTFVFFLKYSARRRAAGATETRRSVLGDPARKGSR